MNNSIEREILLLKAEAVIAELAEAVCPGILLNAVLSLEARTTGIVDDSFLSRQFDSYHEEMKAIQYHFYIAIDYNRLKKLIRELTLELPQNPIYVVLLSTPKQVAISSKPERDLHPLR